MSHLPPGPAVGWLRRRLLDPMAALLRQGLSPRGLAWSLAVGLALGVNPVMGTSTLLCALAGVAFRLNQPALQLANYLAYPLQLLLLIPFIRVGERLTGQAPLPLSVSVLVHGAKADAWGTLVSLGSRILPPSSPGPCWPCRRWLSWRWRWVRCSAPWPPAPAARPRERCLPGPTGGGRGPCPWSLAPGLTRLTVGGHPTAKASWAPGSTGSLYL